ncbi:MAG: molecular chaperone HtpG [Deltaproteobacteria bacterium]|nr:molecular chaperone HtpG [Candidatus Zymogenaceae bacterium]
METYSFQAEAKELLDLMIHSIYSNKDIFLRELISNGSDALDKLTFAALTDKSLEPFTTDPHIEIEVNPDERTLTVRDTGIGMTKDEVIEYVGTIARSGTREFLHLLKESKDAVIPPELIGQFGVGLYASFMVAEKITLTTKKAGTDSAVVWESVGDGTYTLDETEKETPGTDITLFLKPADTEDGMMDYTSEWVIRDIVRRYSDYVAYPIRMPKKTGDVKDEKKDAEVDVLNSMKAIWTRPPDEVSDEEYGEFYKHISHDWNDPLTRITFKAEGTQEFTTLLFIPQKAPLDLFIHEMTQGIHLYIKRVFIMNDFTDLIPDYLRFVRGVVDSEDLPLNISREILQQDRRVTQIRNRLTSKILDTLTDMKRDDQETYRKFWGEFGRLLKEGIFRDRERQEKILEISLFSSTHDAEQPTDLQSYVDRMKKDQDAVYYLTGADPAQLADSPHLEVFKKRGIEVLLLSDPVDEVWVQAVSTFSEKPFVSVGAGEVDLGDEGEKEESRTKREEREREYQGLMDALRTVLQDDVKQVRLSSRLTDSPVCLVGNPTDMTPQMEKLLRAAGQDIPAIKRILEINPDHPILIGLNKKFQEKKDDPTIEEYARLLYGQALLAEGSLPPNPGEFSRKLAEALSRTL